jgi:hypothetical protein
MIVAPRGPSAAEVAALLVGCATAEDLRDERHLCREEPVPTSLDETGRHRADIVLERSLHVIAVGEDPGYRTSRVPYSGEWCWITL